MKNLLMLLVLLLCVYLYLHPTQERAMPEVAAQQTMAPQAPKVYFHSPLDAPAMPTSMSTGMGYYSDDQNSRFSSYQSHTATSGGSVAGGPTVYGNGGPVSNTVNYHVTSGASTTGLSASQTSPRSYVTGRVPNGGNTDPNR